MFNKQAILKFEKFLKLKNAGTAELLPAILQTHATWSQRVPTARLNKWLVRVR